MNHNFAASCGCERSEELLAYLYDEASKDQRKSFAQHLTECDACREEYAVLGDVRETITVWREESLAEAASLFPFTQKQISEKRSALRAVQEFFRLAPVWMQAGGAIAALLLCALATFALVNFGVRREKNATALNTETHTAQKRYSQGEVEVMIAESVQRGIENYKQQIAESRELPVTTTGADKTNGKSAARDTQAPRGSVNEVKINTRPRNQTPRVITAARERQPTIVRSTSDGVPRLSDLLDVVN